MKKFTLLNLIVLLFSVVSLRAQTIISPTSATSTLTTQLFSNLNGTIDGSGLSAFPSATATHASTLPWTSYVATNAVGSIDFNLGGSYSLDGLVIWNQNDPRAGAAGIQGVTVSYSTDSINFTPITGGPTTFSRVNGSSSPGEQFNFPAITATHIRFDITSNYGDSGNLVGFGEVGFLVASPAASPVINPVGATTTLGSQFGSTLAVTIDGTGLDIFPSATATHDPTTPNNSFLATNAAGSIDFDLGGMYLVDGLAFWNINAPGPGAAGINDVVVSSSTDGVTFSPITGSPANFAQSFGPTSPSQQFSFAAVTASHIRFDVVSNHGDPGNLVAFAEVAFTGVVAAPASPVINPISASTTLSSQFGSTLAVTIDGTGLDVFPSATATHDPTTPNNSFLATNAAGSIDFDLGGMYLVDGLAFWNINAPGPGAAGINDVVVSSSTDGVTFTPITGSPTNFAQSFGPTSPSQQFSFAAVTASHIRFDVVSNHGDPGNLVAFAEVAFTGVSVAIPSPVINPVSATTTLSSQFGSTLAVTLDGTGLDVFPSATATHDPTTPNNSFYATNASGSIDFDLGGMYLVDGLAFWNINAPGPGAAGINDVVISSSIDGINFTPIAGSPANFAQSFGPTSSSQQFSFAEVSATHIRFDVLSNHGDPGNLVGFAELAFTGVSDGLSVNQIKLDDVISLYPNPAENFISLDNSSEFQLDLLRIFDMNGRLIKQIELTNDYDQQIDISDLNTGIYLFHISGGEMNTVKRVIKR